MICEKEWDLMKDLIDLFQPFDELTTYFSGANYATMSSILLLIEATKSYYYNKLKELCNEKEFGKLYIFINNTIIYYESNVNAFFFYFIENFETELDNCYDSDSNMSFDDNLSNNNVSYNEINNETIQRPHKFNLRKNPPSKTTNLSETALQINKRSIIRKTSKKSTKISTSNETFDIENLILKRICKDVYKSLLNYWEESNENALITTILDPRFKDLIFLSDNKKNEIKYKLIKVYEELEFNQNINITNIEQILKLTHQSIQK